jgi:hypothetical protein
VARGYERELELEFEGTPTPRTQAQNSEDVRKLCRDVLRLVNGADPTLRKGGAAADALRERMADWYYRKLDEWGRRLGSLTSAQRALVHKCFKHLQSVVEPEPRRLRW